MTKKEFLEWLNGFGKEAGEFTEEELYLIGSEFKKLPLSEKNWTELVTMLGVTNKDGETQTGENFRCWVKSKQYEDGTIKKNIGLISGKTIEDISFQEFEEKTEEMKRDLYKQQVKTRDQYNAYRKILRDDARLDVMKDLIKDSVMGLKSLPEAKPYVKNSDDKAEAVLLLSDLHIGVQVDSFYNKYNVDIARARVEKLVHDTIDYCHRHNVHKLNILNMGDMIHGTIHVSARLEQEIDAVNQVMIASEILANAVNKLQEAAPIVIYRSCTDNHSRMTANLSEHIEKENLGKLIDFYLEARLKDSNVIFAHDNIDDEIGLFELCNGEKLVFAHGHHDSVNSSFQAYCGATKQFIKYICLGHYHSSKLKTFEGSKVIVNGSICGPEQYALSKRLFGDPEQTLLIFEGQNLTNIQIGLNIREAN